MEIGPFIKLHRIEQQMTQEELAKGIVSMSYLSKIENQRTEASPEVIHLLCTRLGVELDNQKDATIKDKCEHWYKMLFEGHDKEEIIAMYKEIRELMASTHSDSLVMFEIHTVRYYIVLGQMTKALAQINKLNEVSSTFDSLHKFYWYKFKGNYNSLSSDSDYHQALRMYQLAEEKLNQLELPEEEIADLQYTISVTHSKLRNTLESIKYADKALDTYRQQYNFIRCAQCHILLGISYRRIKMYDKSIKNHNLAKHLGKLSKDNSIIQLANQNLGYLHATKGDKRKAIKHYVEVANDERIDVTASLTAVTSLIKEYYSIQNIEETKRMIEKGKELLQKVKSESFNKIYYYIIYTYKYAIDNEKEKFENIVIKEFLPFLETRNDYGSIVVYASMLGLHYEQQNKYKDSVKYYKLANDAYQQMINL